MSGIPPDSIHPETAAAWRGWLEQNHADPAGVWLIYHRQATGKRSMTYDEAVEIALCFGWIDSKPRALDDGRSMLWFSPRRKGSAWSRKNKERIERLVAQGQMHAAGLARIKEAQADGSWTLLDAVERLEIPPDLQEAFLAHPPAETCFAAFPRSTQRAILEWIGNAKTDVTRSKRIDETARLAAQNIRANQWVKKT